MSYINKTFKCKESAMTNVSPLCACWSMTMSVATIESLAHKNMKKSDGKVLNEIVVGHATSPSYLKTSAKRLIFKVVQE